MKTSVLLVGAAVLALYGAPALAADAFTLTIPVEFKSLNPEVKSVLIRCLLEGEDPTTKKKRAFGKPKNLSLPIANGNYTGASPVKIVFAVEEFSTQDRPLLNAVSDAQCSFDLVTDKGTLPPATGATTNPILEHKSGTPYETVSHGTVPK